jgi:hypothetical protein
MTRWRSPDVVGVVRLVGTRERCRDEHINSDSKDAARIGDVNGCITQRSGEQDRRALALDICISDRLAHRPIRQNGHGECCN